MKRILVLFSASIMVLTTAGCFHKMYVFGIPPYLPIETDSLPKRVKRAFKKDHKDSTIFQVQSHYWVPTDEEHYRIVFDADGENKEAKYTERGKQIGSEKPATCLRIKVPTEKPSS